MIAPAEDGEPCAAHLRELVHRLAGVTVVCVGDLMLDRFVHGTVERISPEAPIPVLRISHEVEMPGGVGNVAANLVALGARVRLHAVTGDDSDGRCVTGLISNLAECEASLLTDPARPTTVKTRCVGQHQQMLRIDRESSEPLTSALAAELALAVTQSLQKGQVLLISDYRKGVVTTELVAALLSAAEARGIPVLVDPKGRDYGTYRGAALVTPNRGELAQASGLPVHDDAAVATACRALLAAHGFDAVLATRSEEGMTLVTAGGEITHIRASAREVFDVAGAGDTVLATLAACVAAGAPLGLAARLANRAAGIVVAKAGTATPSREELLEQLRDDEVRVFENRIADGARAQRLVADWQARGLRVGFTNGCFDLLHPGHVALLASARSHCDRLVIGLNSDASVNRLKGPGRPVQGELARATVLASLTSPDLVVVFEEDTPRELIARLRPDVLMKGADYSLDQVVGRDLVEAWGGEVKLLELVPGHSTTRLVERLQARVS
jgi:D-beta-D-heptose 7-phosphate kinase/D-beta-D-heptose 1-phosphate adenosyltransferase